MLADSQLKIAEKLAMLRKLVPNLFDKEKYVIHYENVQLYLRLGLKLKKYVAH